MGINLFIFPLKWFGRTLLLGTMMVLISSTALFAQRTITGTVTSSEDGLTLPGVNVIVQGTATGSITTADGTYSVEVPEGDVSLQFSYIGYMIKVVPVGNATVIDVVLDPSAFEMDEVVVTALGIQRQEKTLTYAQQTVDADELTKTRDINFMNSLNGKAAGVEIKKNASGPGGSTRIVLRGTKSLTGDSEPLFVIDGIPMANNKPSNPGMWGGWDGGDGLSQLNQEDIESVTILKGSNAAALYGSQGANGVVLITTKSGTESAAKVSINSGISFDNPMVMPELQFDYGAAEGSEQSWDYESGNYDDTFVKDFFQTGYSLINSISVSGGSNRTQAYFSYGNTTAHGIVPTNKYHKNNVTFKQSTKLAKDKVTVSSNILLTEEKAENRMPAGYYLNPVLNVYQFPRQMDFDDYYENYEYFDESRNLYLQNVYTNNHFISNPAWILNNEPREDKTKRAIASLSVAWDISEKVKFAVRGNADLSLKTFEQQHAAGSNQTNVHANGAWDYRDYTDELYYSDAILTYNDNFGDVSLNILGGASYQNTLYGNGVRVNTGSNGLIYPNEYMFQNVPDNVLIESTVDASNGRKVKQALFANATVGFKEMVFLDLSARNDWASTLALTGNQSYFYPAAGLTFLIHNMFTMPEVISFAKLRGSYTYVGNEVPFNRINPQNTINAGGGINRNTQTPFTNLKPELITSMEIGADVRFFTGRLGLDVTYYNITSNDQFLELSAPSGSGYTTYFVNAGEIVNKGWEVTLNAIPVQNSEWQWNTALNFSKNTNVVNEIHPDIETISMGSSESVAIRFQAGGSMGDLYTSAFLRENFDENAAEGEQYSGRIVVGDDGTPRKTQDFQYMGNVEPAWSMGWNNNMAWKNFTLSFLINMKMGGVVVSQTEAMLDGYGVSKRTGDARDAGYVEVDAVNENDGSAVTQVDPKIWYLQTGDRNGIMEYYVYDRTNIRLAQLSLGYTFNFESPAIENLTLSLFGRNLFFFYKEAPFDPDLVMSTNRNNQGLDNFNLPTTRSIGLNLNINF